MIVREITQQDRVEWTRMRDALWPGSLADHDQETRQHFATADRTLVVFRS